MVRGATGWAIGFGVAMAGLACQPEPPPPPPDLRPDLNRETAERKKTDEAFKKQLADEKKAREDTAKALVKGSPRCEVTCADKKAACCRCVPAAPPKCTCHDTAPQECATGGDGAQACAVTCP